MSIALRHKHRYLASTAIEKGAYLRKAVIPAIEASHADVVALVGTIDTAFGAVDL